MAASRPGGLDPTQFGAATALRTAPGVMDPLAASMQGLYLGGGAGGGGGGYKPGLSATQMAALQVRSGVLTPSSDSLPRPALRARESHRRTRVLVYRVHVIL